MENPIPLSQSQSLYYKIKYRIFTLLHEEFQAEDDKLGKFIVKFLTILISLNVIAIVLDSVESIRNVLEEFFWIFEVFSISIFTTEYVLEVWTVNEDPKFSGIIKGRLKYMISGMALIDLLAILPFYLPQIFPFDLRFLRILRMFRIFHLFTLGHYSDAFETIGEVIKEKKEALIMTGFIGMVIIFFSAILIYEFEHQVQPAVFPDLFFVIYWVGITLASITHGNIFPITPEGIILANIIEILGIMFFILPTGVVASGFISHMQKVKNTYIRCPHCNALSNLDENKQITLISISTKDKIKEFEKQHSQYAQDHPKLHRVYDIINHTNPEDRKGQLFAYFLVGLILLSILSVMLETLPDFYTDHKSTLSVIDTICVVFFTIEYLLRIVTCRFEAKAAYFHPVKGRIRYIFSSMALIDLFAILPFYLVVIPFDLRFLRIVRLIRFIRLFKFGRYSVSLESMGSVFREKKESLGVSLFIGFIFLVFFSTITWHFENAVQPEAFSSIPQTMWWVITTMTSVGSEIYPMTIGGRLTSMISGFLFMSLLALPTGIIGAGFVQNMQVLEHSMICPNCEKQMNKFYQKFHEERLEREKEMEHEKKNHGSEELDL